MPVLDANALQTDPEGMEFLRVVLRPHCADGPASGRAATEDRAARGPAEAPAGQPVAAFPVLVGEPLPADPLTT